MFVVKIAKSVVKNCLTAFLRKFDKELDIMD